MRQEAANALQARLGQCLLSEQWVSCLAEHWLAEREASPGQCLGLWLPRACQASHVALRERLNQHWQGPLQVHYHDQERFLFRLGDQVLELDVPATAEREALQWVRQLGRSGTGARALDAEVREQVQAWFGRLLDELTPILEPEHDPEH
ncbi:hypothetical protein [Pseudomonas typographi]|uniref:Type III secretion protein n=3 Tax=Pseudomonas typographi TaxID=2715964 RepID=A0ABR7Z2C2_9PSED|nr:hypothetical protein [Pseudomonas typographi]MBD1599512.1 hypothetical protein [Pseudomonas typographi]